MNRNIAMFYATDRRIALLIAIQVAGAHTAERVKGGTKGLHSERVTAGLGGGGGIMCNAV